VNTDLVTWVLASATLDTLAILAPHLVSRAGLATFVTFQFATTIAMVVDTASSLANANATVGSPELIVSKCCARMTAQAMDNATLRVQLVLMVPLLHPFLRTEMSIQ
jgi:hypothetical protein